MRELFLKLKTYLAIKNVEVSQYPSITVALQVGDIAIYASSVEELKLMMEVLPLKQGELNE